MSVLDWNVIVLYSGEIVAGATFTDSADCFYNLNVWVDERHRRRGICNSMYVFAEILIGNTLDNFWASIEDHQSPEAKALWAQAERPFGQQARMPLAT